jgi:hypothetical protein
VGYVFWMYLQLGDNFQKASWMSTKEAFHLFISLDNNSQFNDAYSEKLWSIDKILIQGCMDFTWTSSTALTFIIHAFEKNTSGQTNCNVFERFLSFLSESQLAKS